MSGDAPQLSVSIICRDNAATIGRVLESVRGLRVSAEIVALDSGSRDATPGMIRAAGGRVIDQPWLGYVKQKQAALEACRGRWVLCLDSDESLDDELRAAVEEAVDKNDPAVAGYELNRRVWYMGRPLRHAWQPEWRLRLVRAGAAAWGGYDPHDELRLLGAAPGADPDAERGAPVHKLRGHVRHECMPSVHEFLARQVKHAHTAASSMVAQGRRTSLRRMITSPMGEWLKQMVVRGAWRDGWRGVVAAGCSTVSSAMKHAVWLEMQEYADGERTNERAQASVRK